MAAVATPAREQESNALGIAALVMGIIAVVACLVPLVGIFGLSWVIWWMSDGMDRSDLR